MTPAARAAAAIKVLDDIIAGDPAERALIRWARGSRFAGSGDRGAVRDLVFDALRKRASRAALGGSDTGRGLILGMCRETRTDPASIFTGGQYAPAPLTSAEGQIREPSRTEALNLPDWIIPRMQSALGTDFEPVANALQQRAPVWLRVNVAKATPEAAVTALAADGVETEQSSCLDTALRVVAGERRIARSAAYSSGLVELQDLSPQLACAALNFTPEMRVLDFCAGGGGKSLALAAGGASVDAFDADAGRMADLPARVKRAGVKVRRLNSVNGTYDLVVVDAPCSGSGTWRRTPDAKWRLKPEDLDRLVALQAEILDRASAHVTPGGALAYMTCSMIDAENGEQIERFLSRHPHFNLLKSHLMTPLTASDGFYWAVLTRR
ncbi:MAG: SAM-dependent methyltransferase [Paracoccus denitrificans]|nr:MAG: SAM-dependent methyltransferase [Paracoccus denitrificans]PZO84079.1 MAG: SAM-dependent methyltransferase [Paracoccus denitrificans]